MQEINNKTCIIYIVLRGERAGSDEQEILLVWPKED